MYNKKNVHVDAVNETSGETLTIKMNNLLLSTISYRMLLCNKDCNQSMKTALVAVCWECVCSTTVENIILYVITRFPAGSN